jgi:hypothetical protein
MSAAPDEKRDEREYQKSASGQQVHTITGTRIEFVGPTLDLSAQPRFWSKGLLRQPFLFLREDFIHSSRSGQYVFLVHSAHSIAGILA